MDDEGYTSPSEEDFRYNPNRTDSFGLPNVGGISKDISLPRQEINEDVIPWDIIAALPYTKNCHLTWDDIQIPIPYRFHRNWNFPSTISSKCLRKSAFIPYFTDNIKKSTEIVDAIWKACGEGDILNVCTKQKVDYHYTCNDSYSEETTDDFSTCSATYNDLKNTQEKPVYISLQEFIQHSLHLLAGRESHTFTVMQGSQQFKKNPIVLVKGIGPTTLLNYCKDLLECGSLVSKLNAVCRYQNMAIISEQGNNYTALVYNSCLEFISNYLQLYQTVLMLKGDTLRTLTQLKIFNRPFYCQLKTLDSLFNTLSNEGSVLDLLTSLNYLLASQETPYIEDMMRGLFITCTSTYCKYVSDWIFRGKLGPASEFHIEIVRESEYTDRRYWTKLFVQKNTIPMYLEESAQLIFETGKSVNLLNRIQTTMFKSSQIFCNSTETIFKPHLTFESLQQLTDYWQLEEDKFFRDNAFLKSSLDLCIQNVLNDTFKMFNIDPVYAEQAKEQIVQKLQAAKLNAHLVQQNRSRELMRDLQEQIHSDNERKSQDENLPLYQRLKMKQYLLRPDDKNSLEQPIDHDTKIETKDIFQYHQGDVITSQEDTYSIDNDGCTKPVMPVCLLGLGQGDDFVLEEVGSLSHLSVSLQSIAHEEICIDRIESLSSSRKSETIIEEKFNPDKVIVRRPPEYKYNYFEEFGRQLIPLELQQRDEKSKQSTGYDPYCLNYFLSQSVLIPLSAQNRIMNATLLHHLIVENNLFYHVSALNSFMCLQNGLFSYNLSTMLIQEVVSGGFNKINDLVRKTVKLNIILTKALTMATHVNDIDTFSSNLSFSMDDTNVKSEKQRSTKEISKFSSLNDIRLNYTVGWPLNIILTDDLLSNYEKIFVFLMQIVRAEMLLDKIFSVINFKKVRSKQLDTIHYCRYRMLHFVRTVKNYVNVTVIDTAWTDLCGQFKTMDSLDKIYDGLVKHIKSICSNCLHGAKAERLLKLLTDQLVIIENFCGQLENLNVDWGKGEGIPPPEFKKLVQNFLAAEQIGKVFLNVAWKMVQKGYYPKVDYFLKLYNFNGFFSHEINSLSLLSTESSETTSPNFATL